MANESGFWRYIKKGMKGLWRADRIESMTGTGIPDVAFTTIITDPTDMGDFGYHGWMELKHVDEWPKRASTDIKIAHYTRAQRNWLFEHGKLTNMCFLFLKVGSGRTADYLLFDHVSAADVFDGLTKEEMMATAIGGWYGSVNWKEFERCLWW